MKPEPEKAMYYEKKEENKVRCLLCPHRCLIAPGKKGLCKVRKNIDGTLYTFAYGNLIAIHVDPIEKKPLYHFFPGEKTLSIATPGCNFRCLNCQNHTISQVYGEEIFDFTKHLSPEEVITLAIQEHIKHITFTYTEPTIFFEYMLDTAKTAIKSGIHCSMVSNGYIEKEPLKQLSPYIEAANIDLKFIDDNLYREITGGTVEPVIRTIETLYNSNVITEVTTLIIPGLNDSKEYFTRIAEELLKISKEIPWHLSAFYPTYKMTDRDGTPALTLKNLRQIAIEMGLKYVYTGNILDLEGSTTFCPECKKPIIERLYYTKKRIKIKDNRCAFCNSLIYGKFQ